MTWTDRDTQGINLILLELKGLIARHRLELTSDLLIREQHAEHDVAAVAHMLGGDVA
jgi:hypothetical protein